MVYGIWIFGLPIYSLNFNSGKSKKKVLERNDVILVISVPSLAACVEE